MLFANLKRSLILSIVVAATLAVSGCTPSNVTRNASDPWEYMNRGTNAFNKGFDRNIVKPVAKTYGVLVPPTPDSWISNFAENASLPSRAVNNLLQLNIEGLVHTTIRFAVNTLGGFGGIFDPASQMNLPNEDADFGQTLHVWGAPAGNYIELPILGPSNERDAIGIVADIFLDPVGAVLPDGKDKYLFTVNILDRLGDRNDYTDLVDGVFESEDSYASLKQIYEQSRRHKLEGELREIDLEDPYAN